MNGRTFRTLDLFLAIVGLATLSPLLLIVSILVCFDLGKPLYFQTRVGRAGNKFTMVKFRTIDGEVANMATHHLSDDVFTPLGRFLRRTKVDELPQLWNVLRGEMSLVGPRPSLYEQEDVIRERQKLNVYSVLPGITGLAQVNGIDMSDPQLLAEWDAKMIAEFSLKNYFTYLIQTVLGKGGGDRTRT